MIPETKDPGSRMGPETGNDATGRSRIGLAGYTVIPVWYGCNNDCVICMLAPVKGQLPAVDFDLFKKLVIRIVSGGRCRHLILSGAEVTTFPGLGRYVAFAAAFDYFETIQVQTNGRKLCDAAYLRGLIDAGVNEFFISIHGPREVHDAISRVPGSYDQTMQGIGNLRGYPVNLLTNTVLTRLNYGHVAALIEEIAGTKASEMHLWNFFPMEEGDSKDLIVSMKDLLAALAGVPSLLRSVDKPLVLKGFPECLPVSDPVLVDSDFPPTLIPDVFWKTLARSGFGACCHRDACTAKRCWGLSRAYIAKYGDERDILSPVG